MKKEMKTNNKKNLIIFLVTVQLLFDLFFVGKNLLVADIQAAEKSNMTIYVSTSSQEFVPMGLTLVPWTSEDRMHSGYMIQNY